MSQEFNADSFPTARKQYRCEWCGEPILVGEKHLKYVGIWEGDFQNWRMHLPCNSVNADSISEGFTPFENEREPVEH